MSTRVIREITVDFDKKIKIYDNLFDLEFRQHALQFADCSTFKIGWADGAVIENQVYRFLHSSYSEQDIENLGIMKIISKTSVMDDLKGYNYKFAMLNLSTPADANFVHAHPRQKVVLYYVNLEWRDGWHGETVFYDEACKEITYATAYIPGRLIVFDGSIPHAIRPQSVIGPKHRFTLAMVFEDATCN